MVSVITRRGRDLRGPEISGEVSSFDTYRGRASYGNKFANDVELFLSGTWSESLGPRQLFYQKFNQASNNFGIAQGLDDDHGQSFFGKLAYNDLSLQGAWMTREKGNPTAQFGAIFNDPRLRTTDERSYASLQFTHEFPDVVDITAQVYYDRGDFSVDYPRAATLLIGKTPTYTVLPLNRDLNQGEWWGAEVQLQRTLWEKHVLTLGGEYRDDFRLERANLNADTGVLTGTPRTADRQSHGLYVQGDFTLHSSLHLVSGVRYDQYGGFEAQFNPRHALVYNPVGSSVFKFIYGTAFRAPTFIESINQLSAGLRPETITGYELIYEQGIGPHLRSTLSLFYNQIDNLIVFDSTGKYANAGNALAKGLEAGVEGFWTGGIRTRVSYTIQEAEDQASGARLTDSPRHLGKLNLSVPLVRDRLFAGLEWQYTSGRMTAVGTEAAGFGVVNATLFSQKLARGLEISASVYNLLDRQYSDPATPLHQQDTLQRDGRSFRVKVTYRF